MSAWAKILHLPSDTTPLLADAGSSNSNANLSSSADTGSLGPRQGRAGDPAAPDMAASGMSYDALWSDPLGGPARDNNDEHLLMFRRAVGINSDASFGEDQVGLEQGQRGAVGIYRTVVLQQQRKQLLHHTVSGLVWGCHGVQIVVGATLTCLGLKADDYPVTITVLGAVNTAVAGFLALVKGKGLPEKLGKSEADFRQLKIWIEETETLLALGVIGRNRKEIGVLIESAFRRYNACFGRSLEFEAEMDRDSDDLNMAAVDAEESGAEDGHLLK